MHELKQTQHPRLRPRAILFDHDGVLVASEPLHWAAWEGLTKEIGIPFEESKVRNAVGKTAPEILMMLLRFYRPDWTPSTEQLQTWVNRKNEIYLEEAKAGLKPYPGVQEGLNWLRAHGIKTGVVSNARRRELNSVLDHLGLSPLMDVIISREDAGASKPDPTPYLFGAASLGVEPAECFAIEDSPTGMEAGLLAKIPTAGVLTNFSRSALESPVPGRPDLKPFWIGETIRDFFEMVQRLPVTEVAEN
jgi:HAD superfamily hydrolase (TIGR01509 family)